MAGTLVLRVGHRAAGLDVSLDTPTDGVTVLFGPSGAGKTTVLRILAGLERPTSGRVQVDGQTWDDVSTGRHLPARRRRVGYLFQEAALFPHLSVLGNVMFGLTALHRAERPSAARRALSACGVEHLADRRAAGLSGGEAQRVALARALAPQPRLLLLDEPLASLDRPTRDQLGQELARQLRAWAVPALLVTHDRDEALTLGDRAAVLVRGRIRQTGAVESVFGAPADAEVAAVVGVDTVVPGRVVGRRDGLAEVAVGTGVVRALDPGPGVDQVAVCIRAEDVVLDLPDTAGGTSARTHLPATVIGLTVDGPLVRVRLDCGFALTALVTRPARDELRLAPGVRLVALVKAPAVHLVARPQGDADR